MRSVVNNASMFGDGAPTGGVYLKEKKLNGTYKSIDRIKQGTKRVNISQQKAIVKAHASFKGVFGSIFHEKHIE